LTAIAFGLGASAATTGRGSSFKDFIGTLDDKTVVTITIVQAQDDKLCKLPNGAMLGDEIIIERSATKGGQSETKIMDTSKKLLSRKKEDLKAIMTHLNLQIDNPAVVMTQKVTKEFLSKSEPKDFYGLFLKATRVDSLIEKYREAKEYSKSIVKSRDDTKEAFQIFVQVKYQPATEAHAEMAAVVQLNAKLDGIRYEKMSVLLRDYKDEIHCFEQARAKSETHKDKVQALLDANATECEQNKENLKVLQEDSQSQAQRQKKITEECGKVDTELRSAKKAVADQDNQKKSVERAIANFNKDIASVRARKREQLAEAAKLRQTKHPERPESQLPKLNERMDALQTKLSEAAHQKNQLELVDRQKHTQRDEATRLYKDQETQVKEYQQNLNRLESVGKGNSLARFGNDVPRIAAAMKVAERNFAPGKAPVGPIGAYIKLKDPKWGLALCNETNWNRGAQVWLVHSHKDIDVCRKILTDQGIRDKEVRFHTLNTDDFAVKVGEAPEPTILDIVEIDHPNKDCCRYVSVYLNFVCLPRKYSTQIKLAQTQHSLSFTHTHPRIHTRTLTYPPTHIPNRSAIT